jgi:hypothetical protein
MLPFEAIDAIATVCAPSHSGDFKENEDDEQEDDFHRILPSGWFEPA